MSGFDYAVIHSFLFKTHYADASRVQEFMNLVVSGLEQKTMKIEEFIAYVQQKNEEKGISI